MPKITRPRIMVAASFLGLATALGGTAAALGGTAAAASFAAAGQPGTQNQSIHSLAGMVDRPRPCRTRPPPRCRARAPMQGEGGPGHAGRRRTS